MYVCNLPRHQHSATPCPRGKTSKVIAPAEAEECLLCLRRKNVLVLFCGIKKEDCPYATEELGPGRGDGGYALSSIQPCIYIYIYFISYINFPLFS
jgi:hypothetical protein